MTGWHRRLLFGFLVGLAMLTALLAWQGVAPLAAAIRQAGWTVFLVPIYFLVPMAAASVSWSYLFAGQCRPGRTALYFGTWVGLAVNWLLPVAMVGGELVRVRLLRRRGVPISWAAASVMADKTMQLATQVVFGLLGLLVLPLLLGKEDLGGLWLAMFAVLVLIALGLAGFYRVQRAGVFGSSAGWLQRLTGSPRPAGINIDAAAADSALASIYRSPAGPGRGLRVAAGLSCRLGRGGVVDPPYSGLSRDHS